MQSQIAMSKLVHLCTFELQCLRKFLRTNSYSNKFLFPPRESPVRDAKSNRHEQTCKNDVLQHVGQGHTVKNGISLHISAG